MSKRQCYHYISTKTLFKLIFQLNFCFHFYNIYLTHILFVLPHKICGTQLMT